MFETGMSALVLNICSEYAKSLGLNFPPCTQQEINAICQWVDKHAVKDMTISQDGYTVTFTFKGEYDTTKEFTITIPKKVDIDELEKVLKGSDTVVVERLVDNSGLQVSLAQSVVNDINSKLTKPANPTSESAVTMAADGTIGTKPLSEIGGGGKLYRHRIDLISSDVRLIFDIYGTYSHTMVLSDVENYLNHKGNIGFYNGTKGEGVVTIYRNVSNQILIQGAANGMMSDGSTNDGKVYVILNQGEYDLISDTVTEL